MVLCFTNDKQVICWLLLEKKLNLLKHLESNFLDLLRLKRIHLQKLEYMII